MVGEEASGKFERAIRIGPFSRHSNGRPGLDEQRGARDRCSQTPETAAQPATQVEDTEVQTRWCFDEDATAIGHIRSGAASLPAPEAQRSCLPRSGAVRTRPG